MNAPAIPAITPEIVAEHGFKGDEYDRLLEDPRPRAHAGRTRHLLGDVVASTAPTNPRRIWLKKLPTTGPRVIQGPGENAGVIDIGDGEAVDLQDGKPQPSLASSSPTRARRPASAASCATSSPWARGPIANLNALRFGDPDSSQDAASGVGRGRRHRRLRQLRRRADRRRRDQFPPRLQRQHPGQRHVRRPRQHRQDLLLGRHGRRAIPVVYVGSKTGRDGIHGATMASAEFDDEIARRSARPCRSAIPSPRSC